MKRQEKKKKRQGIMNGCTIYIIMIALAHYHWISVRVMV